MGTDLKSFLFNAKEQNVSFLFLFFNRVFLSLFYIFELATERSVSVSSASNHPISLMMMGNQIRRLRMTKGSNTRMSYYYPESSDFSHL